VIWCPLAARVSRHVSRTLWISEAGIISSSHLSGKYPLVDDIPRKSVRDYRWLVGVWAVVALFVVLTVVGSRHVGIPVRDPGGAFFRLRIAFSLVMFGLLTFVDASVRTGRSGWTIGRAAAELRRCWPRERLAIAVSGLLAYYIVYTCYHNLKSWDVFNSPRDGELLRFDAWLFFGHSPAQFLHDMLGQHIATYVLAVIYESFGYLVTLSVVSALVFTKSIRDGYVFLTSALWVWILGVGSYYLIPSLGPFAAAPDDFAGLPHTMIASTQEKYLAQRAYLLEHPAASDAFAQISAFASLHVGFTAMILLMVRYYGLRRASQAMTLYLVATMIATIYLGWHYVVDDVAGLALAGLAVLFGRLMIYPRGRLSP